MSDVNSTAQPSGWTKRLLGANAWFVYLFFYAPIVLLVVFSFNSSSLIGKWEPGTFQWYRELADNSEVQSAMWVSVKVGLVSTVISVVLGTLAALSLERARWRGQKMFDALLYLPIIIPDVTMAVMMLIFFTQGFDALEAVTGIEMTKGLDTIALSHIAFSISFVSVVVRARLSGIDDTYEQAAADLYASRWQAFRFVTLPLIMPGILGGALLAMTLSLDDVVITQFVAGPGSTTLPVYVFSFIRKGVTPLINAVSVVLLAASILLVTLSLLAERFAFRDAHQIPPAETLETTMHRTTHHTPRRRLAALAALALLATACGDDDGDADAVEPTVPEAAGDDDGDDDATPTTGATPTTAPGGEDGASGCAPGEVDGDLALYNWSEYIDPALKDAFAEQYGVSVTEDNYDSNEAMQPVVQAGGSGFDVIVPSDYMVSVMIAAGNLMPLDKAAIPNLGNLAPEFAAGLPYDPAGDYSVPYQWGTTGLGVDLAVTGEDVPHSWGIVFDEAIREQYNTNGSITLLNDPRETLGAALKYLGYSLNTTSAEELAEAKELVSSAAGSITAFDSDQYDELLITGETAVAHGYSGNIIVQIDESDAPEQYVYFVPEEGGTRWVDNMAIPFDAPHPCTAHTFIDFILEAENGAALSNWNFYASPNAASEEFIDPEVLEDPRIYPVDDSKLEFIADTGDFEINFSDAFIEAKG